MAVKTITIDMEAYERLKALKLESESFSDVIKRLFKPPLDIDRLMKSLSQISDKAIDGIDEAVKARKRATGKPRRVA